MSRANNDVFELTVKRSVISKHPTDAAYEVSFSADSCCAVMVMVVARYDWSVDGTSRYMINSTTAVTAIHVHYHLVMPFSIFFQIWYDLELHPILKNTRWAKNRTILKSLSLVYY